ncbi:hypothetical protein [Shewanella sp. KCT]|uniref:hypothetical protein n=1 Tax=Shewanella sp. KCT TaxID=2569535 RepID=UPI0011827478|nr:hypothetical protein [Shewanella sp. KCT]TVP12288.1 hypothetical protein AYI87_14760 [Shewanella sp. KCT]
MTNNISALKGEKSPKGGNIKPENVAQRSQFFLTLRRSIKLKRYPIIAKVCFLRERPDLVSLLTTVKDGTVSISPRLSSYLKKEQLWDSGLTKKGKAVLDSGLYESEERCLYHVWYTDHDSLLGSRPVLMQRDTAFSEPNFNILKKGRDASDSEFAVSESVNLAVLEEQLTDSRRSKLENKTLPLVSLNPEVIGVAQKTSQLELEWKLGFSQSVLKLAGSLDVLSFNNKPGNHNNPYSRPEEIRLSIDGYGSKLSVIMNSIAQKFNGHWQENDGRLAVPLAMVERYPSAVQNFQIGSYSQASLEAECGTFQSLQAVRIPIQPLTQTDANDWHQFWVQDYYGKSYCSSTEARKRQSAWLDHPALNEFELPLKEQRDLLNSLSKEATPEAYWHISAMADLTPSKSTKLRMPISFMNGEPLELKGLIRQLVGNAEIDHAIYSDRYVHTSRHYRNLSAIADCLPDTDGLLLTLSPKEGKISRLPENWAREFFEKNSDNHGRYLVLINMGRVWCWECTSGLDCIRESEGGYVIDGSPTFIPKESQELPKYLRDRVNALCSMEEC